VLLYGITGFLLNHQRAFPDHQIQRLGPEAFGGTALDKIPSPLSVAERVLERLREVEEAPRSDYQLGDPERVRYRHQAVLDAGGGGRRYELSFSPERKSGLLHTRRAPARRETPLGKVRRLDLQDSTRAIFRQGGVETLKKAGLSTGWSNARWGPQVEFEMLSAGEAWIVRYNVSNRQITAMPAEGWPGFDSVRQFLIRLHFVHTFPAETEVRTFWALMVDAMAGAMVLWALTGFLMWWQVRAVRLTGAIVATASALWAFGLAYFLYEAFRFAG